MTTETKLEAPNDTIRRATDYIREKGLANTFGEIAEAAGVSGSYLSNLRGGHNPITSAGARELIDAWAETYEIPVSDLLTADAGADPGGGRQPDSTTPEPVSQDPADEADEEAAEPEAPPAPSLTDRIDVAHGDLYFRATKDEDGRWSLSGRVEDDEVVRLLAMCMYRTVFGPAENGTEPNEEN